MVDLMRVSKIIQNIILIVIVVLITYVLIDRNFDNQTNQSAVITKEESVLETDFNILVYFCPEDDCEFNLKYYMNQSSYTKCAVYNVDLLWIYETMKDTNTFFILDDVQYKNYYDDANAEIKSMLDSLESEGKLKTDVKEEEYMHNKFCVFDISGVKYVWVGSANFTLNDFNYNNNNFVIINGNVIAELAENEFDEMFSGTFNGGLTVPTQYSYPKAYFCPEDNCVSHYLEILDKAEKNVWCMFFDLTYDEIGDKFVELKKKGIDVRVIFETRQAGSQYNEFEKMQIEGVAVIKDKNPKTMHNKFCIVDDSYVITGSMNPSQHSQIANDESIIIINNKDLTNNYLNYFKKYWAMWS